MRGAPWIIFFTTFIAYAYFFQGNGWNQAAHFATMRSLAEHGTAEISPFTDHTQDVSYFGSGVYSNKPPGIAPLGTPFYFALMKVELAMHMEIDTECAWLRNLYVMTVLLAALPGAILNVQLFYALRREDLSIHAAMIMCGAFAFGSLSWPYGGMMLSHLATASLVFGAWQLLTSETVSTRRAIGAGSLIAVGILCDFLTIPVAAVLGVYLLARRGGLKQFMVYGFVAFLGIAANLLYDRLAHGSCLAKRAAETECHFHAAGIILRRIPRSRLAPDLLDHVSPDARAVRYLSRLPHLPAFAAGDSSPASFSPGFPGNCIDPWGLSALLPDILWLDRRLVRRPAVYDSRPAAGLYVRDSCVQEIPPHLRTAHGTLDRSDARGDLRLCDAAIAKCRLGCRR